jgi:hypothetical protein
MINSNISDLKNFLLELALYQDQLLQNYRHLFITSEIFLISVAMLLLASNSISILTYLFFIILFIIGCILMFLWRKITISRTLDVSYCHMQLLKLERSDNFLSDSEIKNPFDSFKQWQKYHNDAKRKILNDYDKGLLDSTTRKYMENLPWMFFIIWIFGLFVFGILLLNMQFKFF